MWAFIRAANLNGAAAAERGRWYYASPVKRKTAFHCLVLGKSMTASTAETNTFKQRCLLSKYFSWQVLYTEREREREREGESSVLITRWINFFFLLKFSLQTKVSAVQNPICRQDVIEQCTHERSVSFL